MREEPGSRIRKREEMSFMTTAKDIEKGQLSVTDKHTDRISSLYHACIAMCGK